MTAGLDADVPSKPFGGAEEFTFSPDGKTLVYTARVQPKDEPWSTNFDLFAVSAKGGKPRNLTDANDAWDTHPVFSPDGKTICAGGLDDVIYAWPVALLDEFTPGISGERSFLRDAATMPNGERQFMRKCSICHALEAGPSRKAGPTLNGVFGRRAGTLPGYIYSDTLDGSDIVWSAETIDALFDQGPDHYIPGSKMPMQVIARSQDRKDLIAYLRATTGEDTE